MLVYFLLFCSWSKTYNLQPKYPQNAPFYHLNVKKKFLKRGSPPYTPRRVQRLAIGAPLAPSALHTRARLSPQMQFLDPPMYLAKIGLLHRSPPSLCGSLFMLITTSELSSFRTCNYHTRAPRHVREHLTTETAQTLPAVSSQLTALWRSCCSRREAVESSKQRRPGHLSAAQMCSR